MKIIEALKKVKANDAKVEDLKQKIHEHCVSFSYDTPMYGADTRDKVKEWLQSCEDTNKESLNLLYRISKTNLVTVVNIELAGMNVSKTIAEWIWRRRKYAALDKTVWSKLSDRGLQDGKLAVSGAPAVDVKILRHYDPVVRDAKIALYGSESHLIDSALEIANATTDLLN